MVEQTKRVKNDYKEKKEKKRNPWFTTFFLVGDSHLHWKFVEIVLNHSIVRYITTFKLKINVAECGHMTRSARSRDNFVRCYLALLLGFSFSVSFSTTDSERLSHPCALSTQICGRETV